MSMQHLPHNPDGEGYVVRERGTLVPPWCRWYHSSDPLDLHIEVKDENGESMGFKVKDVMVERRFAIQHDDSDGKRGWVLPQIEFARYFQQWRALYKVPEGLDISKEAVPKARAWINKMPDPTQQGGSVRLVPIGFDPLKEGEAPIEPRYTHDGELEALVSQNRDAIEDSTRLSMLKRMVQQGTLTKDQFMSEVMSEPEPTVDPLPSPDIPPVAEEPAPVVSEEHPEPLPVLEHETRCGQKRFQEKWKQEAHERRCLKCQEILAE